METDFKSGLIKFKRDSKFGLLSPEGKLVVDAVYDSISFFSDGMALVENGGKYGFINDKGKVIIECKYDYAHYFYDGYALVQLDSEDGFLKLSIRAENWFTKTMIARVEP